MKAKSLLIGTVYTLRYFQPDGKGSLKMEDGTVLKLSLIHIFMETFIAKMRRLKGIRKVILIEECWKALMSANMSGYIQYLSLIHI